MKALLNCCQRSSAVQPQHAGIPSTAATTDTPPTQLQKNTKTEAFAALSVPSEQQPSRTDAQRSSSKTDDSGAAATTREAAEEITAATATAEDIKKSTPTEVVLASTGATTTGPQGEDTKEKTGGSLHDAGVVSNRINHDVSQHDERSSVDNAGGALDSSLAASGPSRTLPPETEETGTRGEGSDKKIGEQASTAGRTSGGAGITAEGEIQDGKENLTEDKREISEEEEGRGKVQKTASSAGVLLPVVTEEINIVGGGEERKEREKEREEHKDEIGSVQQGDVHVVASEEMCGGKDGTSTLLHQGGGSRDTIINHRHHHHHNDNDNNSLTRPHPVHHFSLEDMLEKKWQQLVHYLEEEQLFKAYQYLLLLEQQVEHRLAFLMHALQGHSQVSSRHHSSSAEKLLLGTSTGSSTTNKTEKTQERGEKGEPPLLPSSSSASHPVSLAVNTNQTKTEGKKKEEEEGGGERERSTGGEEEKKKEEEEERNVSLLPLHPPPSSPSSSPSPSPLQEEEEGRQRRQQQEKEEHHQNDATQRLMIQKEVLCEFQKKLVSEQTLKNLRMQMAIFHQMLLEFHLDHLLQACEDSRLSCCESLVSTADESDPQQQQPLQQQPSVETPPFVQHQGEGFILPTSITSGGHPSSRLLPIVTSSSSSSAAAGGGGGGCPEGVGATAAEGKSSLPHEQHTQQQQQRQQQRGDIEKLTGESATATDEQQRKEKDHHHQQQINSGTTGGQQHSMGLPFVSERKISSSKTFKQGLRSVVGRKMSFGRRSGVSSKRSAVKKIVTARRKQDDEGWLRERGHCLDLAYRVEKDTSVSMKVRGKLPCMLFQVLAILNETDLAGSWAPFFKSAEREYQYTKASQLVRQVYDYPVLGTKETLMFCVGVNALEEGGCVCIFCRSPPENAVEFMGLPVPPPGGSESSHNNSKTSAGGGGGGGGGGGLRTSWLGGSSGGGSGSSNNSSNSKIPRIQSADLVFLLFPISEGRQTTLELFGNFHHGLRFVPMRLITFVVKKIVRSMFVAIAKQCQHFQTGPYRERVEKDPAFYGWMQQKIEEYVQQKRKQSVKTPLLAGTDSAGSLASFNYEEFQD